MKRMILLLCCWAGLVQAHEVHHRIETAGAVVVTLSYANGGPFAYEKYALTPAGQETPVQVGNTDAAGRIVFIPGTTQQWHLKATSADGHGVNLEFTSSAMDTTPVAIPADALPRWLVGGFGLSLIFGLFGLFQLFMGRKP